MNIQPNNYIAINRIGDEVRGFQVVLFTPKRKYNLLYPGGNAYYTGEDALKCMIEANKRNFESVAITYTNGIEEQLDLEEMKKLY